MTKQLLVIGTAAMTTLLALAALWQFRIVVIYVLISLALAATVRPIVKREPARKFATRLLSILLYVVSLGIFFLLTLLYMLIHQHVMLMLQVGLSIRHRCQDLIQVFLLI